MELKADNGTSSVKDQTPPVLELNNLEIIPQQRKSLEILCDREARLRHLMVAAITPVVPNPISQKITAASVYADRTLFKLINQLVNLDIENISDWELRPARITVGLGFVGISALTILLLLLFIDTLDGELSLSERIAKYWYQYIWFVNLGVTGMFMLGRESMRKPKRKSKPKRRDYSYLADKWE